MIIKKGTGCVFVCFDPVNLMRILVQDKKSITFVAVN